MNNLRALTGVVIDPGHGGADGGAIGNGIVEKELTLDISKYMYDRFRELGVPVALTRDSDVELTSSTRPQKILDAFGNGENVIVISNHINAGGGEGAEVIYALRDDDSLAEKILNNIAQEGQTIRKFYQRRLPSNPAKDYYYVIRETPNTEALIVEYGFLDNAADAQRLKNNYKDYAEAVIRAVMEYKGLNYIPVTGSNYYTVKAGDTLWTIAKNNGLTVNELKELNNLTSNTLTIGQTLKIQNNENTILPDANEYYTVKSGDTLYGIARKYNLTVNELKSLNKLSSNILNIGQKLVVTKGTALPENTNSYTVKAGDTLYAIANKFGVTVNEIKDTNNLNHNNLSIGQQLIIPNQTSSQVYTVISGDTLYGIAQKFNTNVNAIKSLNNLTSNLLSIGQKILIP